MIKNKSNIGGKVLNKSSSKLKGSAKSISTKKLPHKKSVLESRTIKSAPKAGKIPRADIKRAVKVVSEARKKK